MGRVTLDVVRMSVTDFTRLMHIVDVMGCIVDVVRVGHAASPLPHSRNVVRVGHTAPPFPPSPFIPLKLSTRTMNGFFPASKAI